MSNWPPFNGSIGALIAFIVLLIVIFAAIFFPGWLPMQLTLLIGALALARLL